MNRQSQRMITSFESEEWYTPPEFVAPVRKLLGGIDLDPASHPLPQSWIKAERFYTLSPCSAVNSYTNGLERAWQGRVFCNPPYGKDLVTNKSNAAIWASRFEFYYRNTLAYGVLLINTKSGYKWFEDLYNKYHSCLVYERMRFVKPDGTRGGQAKVGQCFIYFGEDFQRFEEIFSPIGRVLYRNKSYDPVRTAPLSHKREKMSRAELYSI